MNDLIRCDTSVLIVARPGRMRDGLYTLLRTIPELKIIDHADNGLAALNVLTDYQPSLLLASNLSDEEIQVALKQTRAQWPETRCLVVVNNIKQQQVAQAYGADDVLLVGFSAIKLFATIERLLSGQDDPAPKKYNQKH